MAQSMKVNGRMIFKMAMALKSGVMDQHTPATIKLARNMVQARTSGLIKACMLANGRKIKSKVWALILGLMDVNTQANG